MTPPGEMDACASVWWALRMVYWLMAAFAAGFCFFWAGVHYERWRR